MIFHLLPEVEFFGEHAGGAISRWVANVVRDGDERVICCAADSSWGFATHRLLVKRWLRLYGKMLQGRAFRVSVAKRVFVLRPFLQRMTREMGKGDVLYIHNRPEYVLALPRAAKRRYRVVLHMHNDHLRNLSAEQAKQLDADCVVYNSTFLARRGRDVVPHIADAVIFNGADERYFYPASGSACDEPTILFVGRLVPEKGVHVLLEAAKCLSGTGFRFQLRIVGTAAFGADRSSSYVEECRRNAPANAVFVPYKTGQRLAEEFRNATIFCSPSTWDEPFGMVNVEAMACGLPVVTTRGGGVPEVFAEGGAIMVSKNSVPELIEALRLLLSDTDARHRLGSEGLASYRRQFRWSQIQTEYRKLMGDPLAVCRERVSALAPRPSHGNDVYGDVAHIG